MVKQDEKNKKESKKSKATKTEAKKPKEKYIHFGWLHRTDSSKPFKQYRKTGGGTTRQISYISGDEITVEYTVKNEKKFLVEITNKNWLPVIQKNNQFFFGYFNPNYLVKAN